MNKNSLMEIVLLAVAVTVSTAVMFTPYLTAQAAGQDAWISVLVSGLIATIPAWAAAALMAKFPTLSVVQALPTILGTVLGKLIALMYTGYFILAGALAIWRLEAFTVRFLLPETPQLVIRAVFILFVAYAAFSGSTPLLRLSTYVVPVGIIVIVLVIGLPIGRMDFSLLFPVFETGYQRVADAAILLLGWLCQVPLVFLMFQRYAQKKYLGKAMSRAVIAVILSTIALELGALGTLATFGPEQVASMFYPAFQVARVISIGAFLEHIEVIFIAVWIAGIYLAAAFFVQAFTDSISDLVQIKGKRIKTSLFVLTIISLMLWPQLIPNLSFLGMISFIRDYASVSGLVMGGLLPVLLLSKILILPPKEKSQVRKPGSIESVEDKGSVQSGEKKDSKEKDSEERDSEEKDPEEREMGDPQSKDPEPK